MKINFKTVLACACVAGTMNGFSQTQHYFRASANGGISTIQYSTDEISPKLFDPTSIGGGVTAEYMMFFNQYVGASAGIGVTMSQSKYKLNNTLNASLPYYFVEGEVTREFIYNAKFENWEEKQMIHTVDIPVGAVGRYSFSDKFTGMAGLGVRFQLPVKATYKVSDDGTRTTTGYFKEANLPNVHDLPHQGFYTLNGGQEGDLNTKTIAFAAYLDLGVMQKIGSQNIYYGIYGQYGFTQINAEAENGFLNQYGPYDSPLNTTAIEKSRLLSFGIKLGYILPVKGMTEEVETTEIDTSFSNLKPELDDHPYTTVNSDSDNSGYEYSPSESVATESAVESEAEPAKKENVFKRFAGKFKKKSKSSDAVKASKEQTSGNVEQPAEKKNIFQKVFKKDKNKKK